MTKRRTEKFNFFVLDVAIIYVLNTRALSLSIVISLILLLPLLLFLFSFVFICKCIQGLRYYLCLFAIGFEVCVVIAVYLRVVWWFVWGIFM